MPKFVNTYIKHYHQDYNKEVKEYYSKGQVKKKKELHEWTEDKDHINWQYLANITNRIQRIERQFIIKQNLKYFLEAKEIKEIRRKLLYEGIYQQLPPESVYQPQDQQEDHPKHQHHQLKKKKVIKDVRNNFILIN